MLNSCTQDLEIISNSDLLYTLTASLGYAEIILTRVHVLKKSTVA